MSDNTNIQNNKRIAKNTLLLYFRMLFMMAVSLYTSRVVLNALGVEDYGIYNVVAGVVSTMAFLNTTLAAASQRFITIELGKKDFAALKQVFANCLSVHIFLGLLIIVILETFGLWFLNTHLNIPENRMVAANIAFQCALVSFLMEVLSVPYNALIIAHERMNAFAYISILEVTLKLITVYLLVFISFDKLIVYAALWLCVAIIIRLVYSFYCNRKFNESRTNPRVSKNLFKSILSFSGYNLIEVFANMLSDQGVNFMLNIFFTPVVNAARGIALQVNGAMYGFVNNFTTAINPQITKNCAIGDMERMNKLVNSGNKYSFLLFMVLSFPVYFKIDYILRIWLKTPPEFCATFIRLFILINLIRILSTTFFVAVSATGKIKAYQIIQGVVKLLIMPATYVTLLMIKRPEMAFYVLMFFESLCLVIKVYLCKDLINLSIKSYYFTVILPCVLMAVLAYIVSFYVNELFPDDFWGLILYAMVDICILLGLAYFVALGQSDRTFINNIVYKRLKINK